MNREITLRSSKQFSQIRDHLWYKTIYAGEISLAYTHHSTCIYPVSSFDQPYAGQNMQHQPASEIDNQNVAINTFYLGFWKSGSPNDQMSSDNSNNWSAKHCMSIMSLSEAQCTIVTTHVTTVNPLHSTSDAQKISQVCSRHIRAIFFFFTFESSKNKYVHIWFGYPFTHYMFGYMVFCMHFTWTLTWYEAVLEQLPPAACVRDSLNTADVTAQPYHYPPSCFSPPSSYVSCPLQTKF